MKPLISVIVPIYKVEAFLPRCLDSIRNQTYRNLEIILVDDGSPDGCGALCDQYVRQDTRIRVIHKKNGGLSSARNAGLDIMRGDMVMFVDSDDWLSPDAVQLLYDRIVRDGSDMVIGQMSKVWADGTMQSDRDNPKKNMTLTREQCLKLLGIGNRISCYSWGKLFRRKIFDNLRFHTLARAEDVWVLPHMVDNCEVISQIPDIIYFYFQRDTSIVHSSGDREHLDSMRSSLHAARFLYDANLPVNAGAYYYSAVKEGKLVQDRAAAKELVGGSFSQQEQLRIAVCTPMHWRLLIPDGIYQKLRKVKRLWKKK